MLRFRELNNLTPEKFNKESMMILSAEYIIKILSILSLIFSSELKLFSPEKVRFVILKLNDLFEKTMIKKNKKNKPPIHCEEDLHRIKVGSRYLIFLKTENPVPVNPEIDSKIELIKVT
jgi:hypothetical protein